MTSIAAATTTLIDTVVVASIAVLILVVLRDRGATASTRSASVLTLTGLCTIGLFYFLDLVLVHVVSGFVDDAAATALRGQLESTARWGIGLFAIPILCVGAFLGLSVRRKAAAELEASEQRFRSIVQDQTDYIVRWKPGGIRTWVNEPYCTAFDLDPNEAVGTSFFPLFSDKDIDDVIRRTQALTPEAPVCASLQRMELASGDRRWQEWTDRAIFDPSGALFEIQSIGRDVTDRIETSRALQKSEARFRSLVENSRGWFFEITPESRWAYSNAYVEEILGYSPSELSSMTIADLLHPDDRDEFMARPESLAANEAGWDRWQTRFAHRNGSVRYLESTAIAIHDEHGNPSGYRAIARDNTLQALLLQLSSNFSSPNPMAIEEATTRSLADIANSYGLDRISVWRTGTRAVHRMHEWARDSMHSTRVQFVTREEVPLVDRALRTAEPFVMESVENLPAEAAERVAFANQNVRSALIIPLFDDESDLGSIAYMTLRAERQWPQQDIMELRLLGEKVATAYRQARITHANLRRERDLARSEGLAHVGTFAFYPGPDAHRFPKGWRTTFSDELCRLLEADSEAPSYDLFISRIHAEDRQRIIAAFDGLIAGKQRFDEHFRALLPSAKIVHLRVRADLEADARGNIGRIVGANMDISAQVEREHNLVSALAENEKLRARLEDENVQLRDAIRSNDQFETIIGDSAALRRCLGLAARAAPTDATVLILGETGTGKELVAKAIHELSQRHDMPLISVNCTALPATLFESELFGHEKGAFTGATARRAGRFELADGGTLFLDEIGDLPLDVQAKLLRVLEDGGFERLGGNKTLKSDVRLITATNRDLEAAVRTGEFRADLYYRISTIPVELPPLRERREDIPVLAHHFVAKHNARLGKSVDAISTRMLQHLQQQQWPGNVRELEHFIERALISTTANVLTLREHLPSSRPLESALQLHNSTELRSVERDHIVQVLGATQWVIDGTRGAAAVLGLAPSTLRSKMKRLGISRRATGP